MKNYLIPALCLSLIALNGCSLFDDLIATSTPTKTKMEGVWEVTAAYDDQGNWILDKINFPLTLFSLSSDNSVASTAGPMTMYLVYGGSKYTTIASKIDQVFNYTGADITGGEWFIDGGNVDRFTLEMKLEGLPGQKTLTELLGMLGIGKDYLDVTVYHKFRDVKVTFENNADSVMTWEFDFETTAVYNTKDKYGDLKLWNGWDTNNFSRCTFILKKRVKDIKDIIRDAGN